MHNFWYDNINTRYGDKASLLYTNTDSLVFQVKTEDPVTTCMNMPKIMRSCGRYKKVDVRTPAYEIGVYSQNKISFAL